MAEKASGLGVLPRTRSEAIVADLRRRILSGEYAPGARLRQSEVADIYGVSTTPVREAFSILSREGLVSKDAHKGVEVFAPSLTELREIYEMRIALEPLATELAATRLSTEQLEELDRLVEEMRVAEPAEYAALNTEFHRQIYVASDRVRLPETITNLRETSANYLNLTVRKYDPGYRRQVHEEHEAILEALHGRAKKRAATLVRKHLEHNQRHLVDLVGEENGNQEVAA